jgi:hypothetical protein
MKQFPGRRCYANEIDSKYKISSIEQLSVPRYQSDVCHVCGAVGAGAGAVLLEQAYLIGISRQKVWCR